MLQKQINQQGLKRLKEISILSLFVMAISACNYRVFDLEDVSFPEVAPGKSILSEKLEPSYASIFANIIEPKCLTCHRTGGRADSLPFETHQDLIAGMFENVIIPGQPDESSFYQVVLPTARRKMPPASSGISPVTESEIEALRIWIENGAPENSLSAPGGTQEP